MAIYTRLEHRRHQWVPTNRTWVRNVERYWEVFPRLMGKGEMTRPASKLHHDGQMGAVESDGRKVVRNPADLSSQYGQGMGLRLADAAALANNRDSHRAQIYDIAKSGIL